VNERFVTKKYNLYRTSSVKFDGTIHTEQNYGSHNDHRVNSVLQFKNSHNFLPKGEIFIGLRNANGFGYDKLNSITTGITNTLPTSTVEVVLEHLNFIDVSRKITEYREQKFKSIRESVLIRLRLRDVDAVKDSIDILVVEPIYRASKYNIEGQHEQHEEPNTICFNVNLSANQPEKVIQFSVNYTF